MLRALTPTAWARSRTRLRQKRNNEVHASLTMGRPHSCADGQKTHLAVQSIVYAASNFCLHVWGALCLPGTALHGLSPSCARSSKMAATHLGDDTCQHHTSLTLPRPQPTCTSEPLPCVSSAVSMCFANRSADRLLNLAQVFLVFGLGSICLEARDPAVDKNLPIFTSSFNTWHMHCAAIFPQPSESLLSRQMVSLGCDDRTLKQDLGHHGQLFTRVTGARLEFGPL